MKKLIIATMIFVGLSTVVSANRIDEIIKKQCQYIVYDSGKNNVYINMYMMGIVDEKMYLISKKKKSDYAYKTTIGQIKERACKEALNDSSTKSFDSKYNWGVTVLIDKQYMKFRTTKQTY